SNSSLSSSSARNFQKHLPTGDRDSVPYKPLSRRKTRGIPRDERLRAELLAFRAFSAPISVPSATVVPVNDRARNFEKGKEKVIATGVSGTEALEVYTPSTVIEVPSKGYIYVPHGYKLAPGYHVTNLGYEVHSSTLNLDQPIAASCQSYGEQTLLEHFEEGGNIFPPHSWLERRLSSTSSIPSSTSPLLLDESLPPTGNSLLRKTLKSGDSFGLPDDELLETQEQAKLQREHFEQIKEESEKLKLATHNLTEKASQLRQQIKDNSTKSSQHITHAARVEHETQIVPETETKEHQNLLKQLSELESELESSQLANQKLIDAQTSLQSELNVRSNAAFQLNVELEQLHKKKDDIEKSCKALTDQGRANRTEIDSLKKENETLAQRIGRKETELYARNEELTEVREFLKNAQEANKDFQSQVLNLRRELTELAHAKNTASRTISEIQHQLTTSLEKNKTVEITLEQTSQRLESALKQLRKFRERLEDKDKETSKLQDELGKAKSENHQLRTATGHHKLDKQKWETERERERAQVSQTLAEKEKQLAKLAFEQELLTTRCHQLMEERALSEQSLKEHQELLKSNRDELEAIKQEVTQLKSENATVIKSQSDQQERIASLKNTNQTLQEQLRSAEAELEQFKLRNQSLITAIRETSTTSSADQNSPENLEQAVTWLLERNTTLERQLSNANTQYSQAVFLRATLEQQVNNQSEALREQQSLLSANTDDLVRTKEELQQRRIEVEKATQLIDYSLETAELQKQSNSRLESDNKKLLAKIKELEKSENDKEQRISQLEHQVSGLEQRNTDLAQDHAKLNS
ncbi:hypothetical protein, partial [Parendozoicomonas sp. Alg238-R29]|uniref:hypothetical protein n=1 Tax=Parendozoicomonas sp. Alg238-R29 TaxID=2993446 RepID=UPI00248E43AA